MSITELVYFLLPAWPGLANMGAAWLLTYLLSGARHQPWQVAHYGRLGGIVVFLFAAWVWHTKSPGAIQLLWQQHFPLTGIGYMILLPGIALLLLAQHWQLKRQVPQGLESYATASMKPIAAAGYILVWVVYLLLYEGYFRGYLLFNALEGQSWQLLFIYNILLYALVHACKNWEQVIASFPFGLLLCALVWYTGQTSIAIGLHITLALGFEIRLLTRSSGINPKSQS